MRVPTELAASVFQTRRGLQTETLLCMWDAAEDVPPDGSAEETMQAVWDASPGPALLEALRELVSIRDWMIEVGRACEPNMPRHLIMEAAERQATAIPKARAAIAGAMAARAKTSDAPLSEQES